MLWLAVIVEGAAVWRAVLGGPAQAHVALGTCLG